MEMDGIRFFKITSNSGVWVKIMEWIKILVLKSPFGLFDLISNECGN